MAKKNGIARVMGDKIINIDRDNKSRRGSGRGK
jgi:hypothetical protein